MSVLKVEPADLEVEPSAVWNQPPGNFFTEAMSALGLEPHDLEDVPEYEWRAHGFPMGVYPVTDAVYAKAWELYGLEE